MIRPLTDPDAARPPLCGICLVVTGNDKTTNRREPQSAAAGTVAKFPRRPDARVLSEAIPLFFIGRNKNGLWVAREAEGRTGGIFLFKQSALRFAKKNSAPVGCATMFLTERFELDVENQASPLIAWLDKVLRRVARLIPDHPPPVQIRRRIFTG
jgi:hypothetical protein